MADKPSDLFVGVIDFFAVILPGAIVVAVAYPLIERYASGLDLFWRVRGDTTVLWAAFIFGAYLAGHLLFLLGALLDDALYDPLRELFVPVENDAAFKVADELRVETLQSVSNTVNTFQWARSILRVAAPAANAEVERYVADSKFFRSFCISLYALTIISLVRRPPAAGHCAIGSSVSCAGLTAAVLAGVLIAVLTVGWVFRFPRRRRNRENKKLGLKTQPEPRLFYLSLLAAAVALLVAILFARNWEALMLFVLALLSLWRYGEQRWKSNRNAYQYMIVLARAPKLLRPPGESAHDEGN